MNRADSRLDKSDELARLQQAFGNLDDLSITESESPDFLLTRAGIVVLGVEVTELFAHQSDARLKKVEGYAHSLLDGGPHRSASDHKRLRVSKVTITNKDESNPRTVDAIIIDQPNFATRVRLLESTVANKELLLANYKRKCPIIDLLIVDSSSLFRFDSFKDFYTPLSLTVSRSTLIQSGFREITLLTTFGPEGRPVRVPLKLNLFVEDLFIFERLLLENERTSSESPSADVFVLLSACLARCGYSNYVTFVDQGNPGFVIGSYAYLYKARAKDIRDYTSIPDRLPTGAPAGAALEMLNAADLQRVTELCEERRKWKGVVDLYFPTNSP